MTTPPPSDPFGAAPGGQPAPGDQPGSAPGYGPPPQQWQARPPSGQPRTEPKAVVALVCAIAAWVAFPVLPAIAALLLGSSARRDIAASGCALTGDGMVTAAKVVAWANLVLSLLGLVAIVLFIAVGSSVIVD